MSIALPIVEPVWAPVWQAVDAPARTRTLDQQIARLHARSTQSLWLDPSDTATLFQDSAGTVAGALNQPVGLVLDRSGKLNHASQSSTLSRPTLILDANGKPCLSFDGSDDALTVTLSTISAGEIIVAAPVGAYWAPWACRAGVWSIGPATYEGGVGDFFSAIGGEINGLMAFDRQLSASERATALAWARSKCAAPNVYPASREDNVILYTAKGQPCHMVRIPRFNIEDIDPSLGTGPHPAFVVGGVVKDAIYIGQYLGCSQNGEMLSLPGVDPLALINHDNAVNLARANGPGWHVMTNAERAAIALWCRKNGLQPRGNTAHGRSSDLITEIGVRTDGLPVTGANQGSFGRTLTGSGPMSWRHDNTPFGIADLSGNVWEWSPGVRLADAEIQVLADNDAAASAADLSVTSSAWRAIDGATGALVAPGSAGTVRYGAANSGTADYTLYRATAQSFEGMANSSGTAPVAAPALARLKALGLFPVASSGLGGDGFYLAATGERIPIRGGLWSDAAIAGVFALNLNNARSNAGSILGARPAFVA